MKLYSALLLSILLAACKNKNVDKVPTFPSDLSIVKVNKKSGIRMFINKIEIKDQAVIKGFIAGENSFNMTSQTVSGTDKIHFFSHDSVSINDRNERLAVSKNDTQFLFTAVRPGYWSLDYIQLIGNMNKYRNAPGLPRYDYKYPFHYTMVGNGNYSEIEISVFNYKLVKAHMAIDYYFGGGEYLYRSVNSGKVFNEFDETYINSLTKTDTLAIEEYSYTFRVK